MQNKALKPDPNKMKSLRKPAGKKVNYNEEQVSNYSDELHKDEKSA
jgi:hypothetical protein